MFLIDTVVLSELRKRDRNHNVVAWLMTAPDEQLYLSAMTIGEIERGIAGQYGKDPAFASILAKWLNQILHAYASRILPVDTRIARHWGALCAKIGNDSTDLLIAATALEHGLTVVTRNVRHFQATGVAILNPFQPL